MVDIGIGECFFEKGFFDVMEMVKLVVYEQKKFRVKMEG